MEMDTETKPLSGRGPTQGLAAFPKGKARPLDPTHQATKDIQHADHGSPSPGPVQVAAEGMRGGLQ